MQIDTISPADHGNSVSVVSRLTSELVGTFVLTLAAAGADVLDAYTGGGIGHVARYLAPGFIVVALIFAFSGISGAHINPAITAVFLIRGVFPLKMAIGYWIAQLAGAILAGCALVAVFGETAKHGVTHIAPSLTPGAGVASEAVLTAVLVIVILGTSEQKAVVGKNAALAVGFTVAACGLFASPISGASMNPARSLGPAIASLTFTDWWIYLVGPLLGALIGAGLVQIIYGSPTESEQESARGKQS